MCKMKTGYIKHGILLGFTLALVDNIVALKLFNCFGRPDFYFRPGWELGHTIAYAICGAIVGAVYGAILDGMAKEYDINIPISKIFLFTILISLVIYSVVNFIAFKYRFLLTTSIGHLSVFICGLVLVRKLTGKSLFYR